MVEIPALSFRRQYCKRTDRGASTCMQTTKVHETRQIFVSKRSFVYRGRCEQYAAIKKRPWGTRTFIQHTLKIALQTLHLAEKHDFTP